MYLLIIGRGHPTEKTPLNGIFEFDQAKSLKSIGHKIIFASVDLRSIRRWRKWGYSYSVIEGIDVYNVSLPLGKVHWRILYFIGRNALLYIYGKIYKIHGKPDIIHPHFTMTGAIASVLKKKMNLPLVLTEHSSQINKNIISKKTYCIGKIAYSYADRIISVSQVLSKRMKQHFNIDTTIIHNIPDTSVFSFSKKTKENKFTFVTIGDLIFNKGHDLLIEAFYLANFNKDVNLYIIGEGHLQKQLQSRINELNLIDQIKMTGLITRYKIKEILHESDAFILASRTETFGLVYIEAMLSGLPVIATRCGGPEEFVNKDNGILIPVNDVNQLSNAMLEIYTNIKRYNGKQISKQCLQSYAPESICYKLSQLYSELLNYQTSK